MNIQEKYRSAAAAYITKQLSFFGLDEFSQEEENHIISLAASVMMTRDEVMMGGGFVQAIVDNDLSEAVNHADNTAIKGLKAFVMVKMWCHLN